MTPQEALKKYFGFPDFRPLQREIVESALAKKDVFALMPTGAGKSLCYQLPAALMPGLTVVISPLIALMKDQVDSLQATGIPATVVNSTLTYDEQRSRIHAARTGHVKLLYIAPERLAAVGFLRTLSEMNVSRFVIDEAHCISEWGHDFRADYRNLHLLRDQMPHVPIMAMTATANERVQQDILDQLRLRDAEMYRASFDRQNLLYQVWPKRAAIGQLIGFLNSRKGESGIIYCLSRKGTENLAATLRAEGFKAEAYNAGMTGEERTRVQENFDHERTDVIVATVAFGMGIDKSNIRFVIHYNLPKSVPAYYQETGRAGRDGLQSDCIMFFGQSDRAAIVRLLSEKPPEEFERSVAELDKMVSFAESQTCRRKQLLAYFGEAYKQENCGLCDNCRLDKAATGDYDGTRVAQMFLSCVVRVKERFGATHVIRILMGSEDRKLLDFRHHLLPTYGVGRDYSKTQWNDFVDQMMQQHLVRSEQLDVSGPRRVSVLKVTDRGWQVLRNERPVMFLQPRKKPSEFEQSEVPALNQQLFEELRTLRRQLAEIRQVPPYIIFSDATLRHIATKLPKDGAAFRTIPGVGEAKATDFGSEFVGAVRHFVQVHGDVSAVAASAVPAAKRYTTGTADITREMYEQGNSIEEIARLRGFSTATITEHLVSGIQSGRIASIERLVPPDRFDIITSAFRQIGWDTLTPIREHLGPDYSWDELRIAKAFFARQQSEVTA